MLFLYFDFNSVSPGGGNGGPPDFTAAIRKFAEEWQRKPAFHGYEQARHVVWPAVGSPLQQVSILHAKYRERLAKNCDAVV
jgi:hypothetical protein